MIKLNKKQFECWDFISRVKTTTLRELELRGYPQSLIKSLESKGAISILGNTVVDNA